MTTQPPLIPRQPRRMRQPRKDHHREELAQIAADLPQSPANTHPALED